MILFLDFDGVLHPDAAYLVRGRPELRAEGSLFMWAPLLADVLADFPKVRIVLSTSWARELRFARARDYLPESLRTRVIGATWHSGMNQNMEGFGQLRITWWDSATRYQQIRRYVDRAKLSDWVAIDDQPEGWADADGDHLIQTDGNLGLSEPGVFEKLEARLKQKKGPLVTPWDQEARSPLVKNHGPQ
ncbi:HAD domain-containing protein [Propionivibrio sp.]|uniref:HAD domain-containing protein n=1 Tax=Propionivibrio sp. TaxID=2212460 RepID=UPI003BF29672